MFPESLLDDVAWCFDDKMYDSLEEFIAAVSEYLVSLEADADWKASEIALNAASLLVRIEEVYDENDEELDLSLKLETDKSSFTNGELLYQLHNAIADRLKSGMQLGDHVFFEGLELDDENEGQYNCFLGS